MLRSLRTKNLQSHKNILLEFHPGVNVLVGSSDSGKTVAMRAIEWIRTNRPLGDDLRSHWGGETVASLKLEDALIIRQKGKVNKYMVDDEDFKAIGADVPEQIRKLLNLSDINVQHQFDNPFLLSYSPGEVAQTLNKLVNIEEIDKALANVAKKLKQAERDLKYETENEVVLADKMKEFEYLDKAEVELSILAALEKEALEDRAYADRLGVLTRFIDSVRLEMIELNSIARAEKDLNELIKLRDKSAEYMQEYGWFVTYLINIETVKKDIQPLKAIVSAETDFKELEKLDAKCIEAFEDADTIEFIVISISTTTNAIQSSKAFIEKLEAEFNTLMPEVCPLCNQKIPKSKPEPTPVPSNGITAKEMLAGMKGKR